MLRTWQLLKQNPYLFQRYFVKEYMIKATRKFFEDRNYHELESPILSYALPQERYLEVLETEIELKSQDDYGKTKVEKLPVYLLPTTETYNKKILAAGLGEHFVITKVMRGLEEIGPNHGPEFTMLEWYHLNADYKDIMKDCEELVRFMKKFMDDKFSKDNKKPHDDYLFGDKIFYKGDIIDISGEWDKISIPEALRDIVGVELKDILSVDEIREFAKSKGYTVSENDGWQEIFELIFASEVETTFSKTKPTFVYNYPKIMCPLTKENKENPLVCEKVELYIAGKELANGYTELTDGVEQERRFKIEQEARKELGMKPVRFDDDLIEALKSGLPDVAGIGMGLDRLAAIFANAKTIAEVNYFPASEWGQS